MGIVFGAFPTDVAASGTAGATNPGYGKTGCSAVVCAWANPSALTPDRYIWGLGATISLGAGGCATSSTSGELALILDRGTTDSVHTTSGLGFEIGKWYFIAILQTFESTTATTSYRVWRGLELDYPTSVDITETTAGVGGSTQSSLLHIANTNPTPRSKSFIGEIGRIDFITAEAGVLISTVDGTITNTDADKIFRDIIIPIWKGQVPNWQSSPRQLLLNPGSGITHELIDLNSVLTTNTIRISMASTAGATTDRQLHNLRTKSISSTITVSAKREPVATFGPLSLPMLVRR